MRGHWWTKTCEYGHFDCSMSNGGPCADEAHCATCGVDLYGEGFPFEHQNDDGDVCKEVLATVADV